MTQEKIEQEFFNYWRIEGMHDNSTIQLAAGKAYLAGRKASEDRKCADCVDYTPFYGRPKGSCCHVEGLVEGDFYCKYWEEKCKT